MRGIQPQHPLVITPHPSNPACVTFPLPPGHPSQKRLTHRRSLTRENASTARITGAKRDDGGGHHDDGPTMVLTTGAADDSGGTNRFDALRQFKLTVDFSMKSVRRTPCQVHNKNTLQVFKTTVALVRKGQNWDISNIPLTTELFAAVKLRIAPGYGRQRAATPEVRFPQLMAAATRDVALTARTRRTP